MRRFDLYHCLGDQLCARILQPTKAAARAEGANGARRLSVPKGTPSSSFPRLLTANTGAGHFFISVYD